MICWVIDLCNVKYRANEVIKFYKIGKSSNILLKDRCDKTFLIVFVNKSRIGFLYFYSLPFNFKISWLIQLKMYNMQCYPVLSDNLVVNYSDKGPTLWNFLFFVFELQRNSRLTGFSFAIILSISIFSGISFIPKLS